MLARVFRHVLVSMAIAVAFTGCTDEDSGGQQEPTPATSAPSDTHSSSGTPSDTNSPKGAIEALDDYTGEPVGRAIAAAKKRALKYAVYQQGTGMSLQGGGTRASSWGKTDEVCEQLDDTADRNSSFDVAFSVPRDGRDCDGDPIGPSESPESPSPSEEDTGDDGGSTGGDGNKECTLKSPAGNCYADGQFCAKKHREMSTYGKGGEYLTCTRDSEGRWRWSDGTDG